MKTLARLMLCGFLVGGLGVLATTSAEAAPGKKHWKHQRTRHVVAPDVAVQVVFSSRDVRVMRAHYAPAYRDLPPGLQKKLRRTGQLPPGWQKKLAPFPVGVERQLVVLPRGYRRGIIDGHAVIVNAHTQVIVDLAVLF